MESIHDTLSQSVKRKDVFLKRNGRPFINYAEEDNEKR